MGRVDIDKVEQKTGMAFSDWLNKKYNEEGLSLRDIGELLDCSYTTVSRYLDKFNLKEKREGGGREEERNVVSTVKNVQAEPRETKGATPGYALFLKLNGRLRGDGDG